MDRVSLMRTILLVSAIQITGITQIHQTWAEPSAGGAGMQEVLTLGDRPAVRLEDGSVYELGRRDEMSAVPGLMEAEGAGVTTRSVDPAITPPPAVDLRQFQTDIRNQTGDTCTVFAITAATEAAYKRKYQLSLDLSERYLNHVQKSHWLNFDAVLPAREIQPETNSGGNLEWHTFVLTRYGLAQERTLSFPADWKYSQVFDAPTVSQRVLDDYNLSPQVFPQAALADARFVPTQIRTAIGAERSDPQWFKRQLALQREVAFTIRACFTDPKTDKAFWDAPTEVNKAVWVPPTDCGGNQSHAMLMVGYSDQEGAFLVKNSWGRQPNGEGRPSYDLDRDGFLKLSYDWVTRGLVDTAVAVVDVADPNRSFGSMDNPQLFLGRWSLVHDGWPGLLDIYRLPRNAARPIDEDIRIGTYWGPDGVPRRVNGIVVQNRIDFCIDWQNPNQSGRVNPQSGPVGPNTFCQSPTGVQLTGYVFGADPGFMSGTLQDRRDRQTYAFYATKYAKLSGVSAAGPLGGGSYLGKWVVSRDGTMAEFLFTSFTPATGELIGTYKPRTTAGAPIIPVKGTVDPKTSRLFLDIRFPAVPPLFFTGYLFSKEMAIMAGETYWGGPMSGFVARRTGDDPQQPQSFIQPGQGSLPKGPVLRR